MSRIITIDPGIGGSGWAVWSKEWELKSWGVIAPKKTKDEHQRIRIICSTLKSLCLSYGVSKVFIEYPQVFRHDIALSGALTKLGWAVGVICGALLPREFELVKVTEWKGQLPKDIVALRIGKRFPNKRIQSHAYDAIGIGLYLKGEF